MDFTTRTGLLGFLLALAALNVPPASAAASPAASIESRLSRIAAAIRERESSLPASARSGPGALLAYGFVNGRGPGGWANTRYGGAAAGPYGGAFGNAHPYYGGGGLGFVNGGGGFVNARPGGGAFANAPYRGGGAFRNW